MNRYDYPIFDKQTFFMDNELWVMKIEMIDIGVQHLLSISF